MADEPNSIDVHVGARIRLRRLLLGMSQGALGDQIGVTFQQVQKYERGANRVSASKLAQIADALDVPVGNFFEGLGGSNDNPMSEEEEDAVTAFLSSREGVALASAWVELDDAGVRRAVLDLIRTVAESSADDGDRRKDQES
jgi:transcriptional regulator with XRE-family HTH domain